MQDNPISASQPIEKSASAEDRSDSGDGSFWGKAIGHVRNASDAGVDIASRMAAASVAGVANATGLANQGLEAASGATRAAIETGKASYSGSKLASAVDYVDNELEQRGAKKAVLGTTDAVIGKLDQVTGKRLVELLEEKLRLQDSYNDILATRLAEALERIAALEARVDQRTNDRGGN